MNHLLLIMDLCGSISFFVYSLSKKLLSQKLSPTCRYRMLKLNLNFFLLPLPLLANEMREGLCFLTGNRELFFKEMLPDIWYQMSMNCRFYKTEKGILFPIYWGKRDVFSDLCLCILLICIFYYVISYHILKRKILYLSEGKKKIVRETEGRKTLWRRKVELCRLKELSEPFTFGFWNAILMLPQNQDEESERYYINHEMEHIRAGDSFLLFFCIIAVALHFYNPFVYLFFREIQKVREEHCDEKALIHATPKERNQYSRLLIDKAEQSNSTSNRILFFCKKTSQKEMQERLELIKNPVKKSCIVSFLVYFLILFLSSFPLVTYTTPNIMDGWDSDAMAYYADWAMICMGRSDLGSSTEMTGFHKYRNAVCVEHQRNLSGGCRMQRFTCMRCEHCGKMRKISRNGSTCSDLCEHKETEYACFAVPKFLGKNRKLELDFP